MQVRADHCTSDWQIARDAWRRHGLRGLYTGYTLTMARLIAMLMLIHLCYHSIEASELLMIQFVDAIPLDSRCRSMVGNGVLFGSFEAWRILLTTAGPEFINVKMTYSLTY